MQKHPRRRDRRESRVRFDTEESLDIAIGALRQRIADTGAGIIDRLASVGREHVDQELRERGREKRPHAHLRQIAFLLPYVPEVAHLIKRQIATSLARFRIILQGRVQHRPQHRDGKMVQRLGNQGEGRASASEAMFQVRQNLAGKDLREVGIVLRLAQRSPMPPGEVIPSEDVVIPQLVIPGFKCLEGHIVH